MCGAGILTDLFPTDRKGTRNPKRRKKRRKRRNIRGKRRRTSITGGMLPHHPPSLLRMRMTGTTDGRPSSAPRPRGMAAGIGTTRIPPPAAGIPAGAPRAILPVSGAGAGTAAVGTHPRGARGGRGAGAGPLHPAGPGNATTPIRTERKLGRCFPWRSHRDCLFYKVI